MVLAYCLSDIEGYKDLQKLKGLPLVRMTDDTIATIWSKDEAGSETKMLYIMSAKEAATLSVLSHKIIKWNVSSAQLALTVRLNMDPIRMYKPREFCNCEMIFCL